ncbi:MAG: DUF3333 domain-containing protein, partial [Desulfococcaceae bacterium]
MSNSTAISTDSTSGALPRPDKAIDIVQRGLNKRYREERRFRAYGLAAIIASLAFLSLLFISIIGKGYTAFQQTHIKLDVTLEADEIDPNNLARANYDGFVKDAIRNKFPDVSGRRNQRALTALVSPGAGSQLRKMVTSDPGLIGQTVDVWVPADDDVDMLIKGRLNRNLPSTERRLKDRQIAWVDELQAQGRVEKKFNTAFFTRGDSREPEMAGVWGAAVGSFYTLVITLLLSFPIGVAAAVYLEEFAPKNRWSDFIEVNINNLAAVPSIVFGLLGL